MVCKQCGKEIDDQAVVCVHCGAATPSLKKTDSFCASLAPVGRSGFAIAAGYLALFSVTIIAAPFALLFGILALRDIKKNVWKRGKGRAWFGIIMGAIFSVIGIFLMTY